MPREEASEDSRLEAEDSVPHASRTFSSRSAAAFSSFALVSCTNSALLNLSPHSSGLIAWALLLTAHRSLNAQFAVCNSLQSAICDLRSEIRTLPYLPVTCTTTGKNTSALNLVFLREPLPFFELIVIGGRPVHLEHLALWPDEHLRLAMTLEAPLHLKRSCLICQRHQIDSAPQRFGQRWRLCYNLQSIIYNLQSSCQISNFPA